MIEVEQLSKTVDKAEEDVVVLLQAVHAEARDLLRAGSRDSDSMGIMEALQVFPHAQAGTHVKAEAAVRDGRAVHEARDAVPLVGREPLQEISVGVVNLGVSEDPQEPAVKVVLGEVAILVEVVVEKRLESWEFLVQLLVGFQGVLKDLDTVIDGSLPRAALSTSRGCGHVGAKSG